MGSIQDPHPASAKVLFFFVLGFCIRFCLEKERIPQLKRLETTDIIHVLPFCVLETKGSPRSCTLLRSTQQAWLVEAAPAISWAGFPPGPLPCPGMPSSENKNKFKYVSKRGLARSMFFPPSLTSKTGALPVASPICAHSSPAFTIL